MSNVIHFIPRVEISAEENQILFINLCKNELTVFGPNLNFDDPIWDISDFVQARGKNNKHRIYFSNWETADTSSPVPMEGKIYTFAKAYVRYQQGYKPIIDITARIVPLRVIDYVMSKRKLDSIVKLNGQILNEASKILSDKFSPERAYRLVQNLEVLGNFLDEHRLIKHPIRWKSSIARPRGVDRVGVEFEKRRQDKLPSADDLEMVAKAFSLAVEPEDQIITSIAAIMCATPDRISEVITLQEKCENEEKNAKGKIIYQLRYWPAKGADPLMKDIIPSFVSIVKEAINRVQKITCDARELARWYELNPDKLYLPQSLEKYRGEPLTYNNVALILWGEGDNGQYAKKWIVQKNSKFIIKTVGLDCVDFKSFQKAIIGELPLNFPYTGPDHSMRFSESLFTIFKNLLNSGNKTYKCFIECVNHGHVDNGFGGGVKHGKSSVFSRMKITDINGAPININSHKFRHYLNTLAKHNGLDELDIAKWSGRKDVRQNEAYDHVSSKDRLALIQEAIGDHTKMFGPLALMPKGSLISRDEFSRLVATTAHTTEFGYCLHDYVMAPCQLHLDCLNCNELVCIKGDTVREVNIRKQRDETNVLLLSAKKSVQEGDGQANKWVEHQSKTLKRLDELCEILDNPLIQNNAVIQLKNVPTASSLVQAAQQHGINLQTAENAFNLNTSTNKVLPNSPSFHSL